MADRSNVAVIDYDAGNTLSVTRALEKVGARVDLTSDPERVRDADAVVLPGVGAFGDCMKKLEERGMDVACREAFRSGKPFLGVCVALQVIFEDSEESPGAAGLGLLPGGVRRFKGGGLKVPHMGWNELRVTKATKLLSGVGPSDRAYFVHSFYVDPSDADVVAATTDYGQTFCAAIEQGNVSGTQFHPEKSGEVGRTLLAGFVG